MFFFLFLAAGHSASYAALRHVRLWTHLIDPLPLLPEDTDSAVHMSLRHAGSDTADGPLRPLVRDTQ